MKHQLQSFIRPIPLCWQGWFILFYIYMSDQWPWDSKLQTDGKLAFTTTYKIYKLYLLSSFRSGSTFFTSSSNDSMLFLVDAVLVTVFILPLILLKRSTNSLFSFPAMLSKALKKISTREGKVYLQNNIDALFMSLELFEKYKFAHMQKLFQKSCAYILSIYGNVYVGAIKMT